MTSGQKAGRLAKRQGVQRPKPNFRKKFEFGQGPLGVGKRLQCHKNSYLKNLVFYSLETAIFCQKISIFYPPLSSLCHFNICFDN